jgi:hypothetical protein
VRGRVWIDGGALVHAERRRRRAAHRRARAGDAAGGAERDVRGPNARRRAARTVHVSTPAALTEAARLVDEGRRAAEVLRRVVAEVPDVLGRRSATR